jgi:hypothetical protein
VLNNITNGCQIARGKFQKQYIAGKDLRIIIVQEDITKMTVDIIVCPQDDFCHSKGGIAKAISKASNEWYRNAVLSMKRVNRCEVEMYPLLSGLYYFQHYQRKGYHRKGYQRKGRQGDVFYQDHPKMTLTNDLFHLLTMH